MLAAAVSAVLYVAVCSLWVRSHKVADAVGWSWATGAVQGGTASGRLRVSGHRLPEGQTYAPPHLLHIAYPAEADPPTKRFPATWSNLGFAFERRRNPDSFMLLVPLWVIALAAAGATSAFHRASRRLLRAARLAARLCPSCGYDLRATPGRCPECGAVPSESKEG
jgi:hypothetical protein